MSDINLLQIPPNAVKDLRSLYNLDKPGRMEEAISILEKWIQKENHILKKDFDREYLERSIIASKGSVEKAKRRIDALCTMRTLTPKLFIINSTKEEFKEIFSIIHIVPLPVLTKDLYRIVILKFRNVPFNQQQIFMVLQYIVLIADYFSRHDYVNGYIFADDFQDLNIFEFVTRLAVAEVQQCMSIFLKGFGARIKFIHVVSQSKTVDLFVNFVKHIVSPKLTNRICVYKSFKDVFDKDLPKDNFPIEYGGKERSLTTLMNEWIDTLFTKENLDLYNIINTARTDESLRSSEKFNTEYMGMPGSFRNLTVD